MIEEGGGVIGSWIDKTRLVGGLVLSGSLTAQMGATSQVSGEGAGEARALSDQFVGKWGPMLGEWSPEKFARMSAEF
jgi:hypothetical protein